MSDLLSRYLMLEIAIPLQAPTRPSLRPISYLPMIRKLYKRIVFLTFLSSFAVAAQQPAGPDVRSLVDSALSREKAETASHARYTNLRRVHETNRDEGGKNTSTWDRLFEETWINDLPYERLVETNGHPLKGKDLRQEQALYDDAVHGRRPLGSQQRILLDGAHPVSSGAEIANVLKPIYELRELPGEVSRGVAFRVVEARHVRTRTDLCSWRYRLWITADSGILLGFRGDVVNADPNGGFCGDATEEQAWSLIDGNPKIAHNHAHFYVTRNNTWTTVDSDILFTNYRRFSATFKLLPGHPIDPSTP